MPELEACAGDHAKLRAAYGTHPSGVTAIAALVDGRPDGLAASSFTSVSLDPPLVSVSMQRSSTTWPRLVGRQRLGISVLGAGHDALCRQLAAKSGDRFAGVAWEATPAGAVLLDGSAAWLECSVHSVLPAGDHEIVLLELHGVRIFTDVAPLVFHASRFRRLAAA